MKRAGLGTRPAQSVLHKGVLHKGPPFPASILRRGCVTCQPQKENRLCLVLQPAHPDSFEVFEQAFRKDVLARLGCCDFTAR